MYGNRVSAVVYSGDSMDFVCYPVKSGIKVEMSLKENAENEFRFAVKAPEGYWQDGGNGYLVRRGFDNANVALIYEPLVRNGDTIAPDTVKMGIEETDAGDTLILAPRKEKFEKGTRLDFSFEFYQNKVPDSSVYSEQNINSYLRHYALVGKDTAFGEGWEYQRFRINYVVQTDPSEILDAFFYLREMNPAGGESAIRLNRMEEDWSSAQDRWASRKQNMTQSAPQPITLGKWNGFDVTKLAKKSISDMSWESETFGLCFQGGDGTPPLLLATSETALYTPYLVIRFKREPEYFVARDSINPPMN